MVTAVKHLAEFVIEVGFVDSGVYKRCLELEKTQMIAFGTYVKENHWVGTTIEDLYQEFLKEKNIK